MLEQRRWISKGLIAAYLVLLVIVTVTPLVLYFMRGPQTVTADEISDLATGVAAPLTGLVGLLGFVLGFYYKEYTS